MLEKIAVLIFLCAMLGVPSTSVRRKGLGDIVARMKDIALGDDPMKRLFREALKKMPVSDDEEGKIYELSAKDMGVTDPNIELFIRIQQDEDGDTNLLRITGRDKTLDHDSYRTCLILTFPKDACAHIEWIGETPDVGTSPEKKFCPAAAVLFHLTLVILEPKTPTGILPVSCVTCEDAAVSPCTVGGKVVENTNLSPWQVVSRGRRFYEKFGFVPWGVVDITAGAGAEAGAHHSPISTVSINMTRMRTYCAILLLYQKLTSLSDMELERANLYREEIQDLAGAAGIPFDDLDEFNIIEIAENIQTQLAFRDPDIRGIFPEWDGSAAGLHGFMKQHKFSFPEGEDARKLCLAYDSIGRFLQTQLSFILKEVFPKHVTTGNAYDFIAIGDPGKPGMLETAKCEHVKDEPLFSRAQVLKYIFAL